MRISDWSADVGSSDLGPGAGQLERLRHLQRSGPVAHLTRGHTGQIAATSTPPICALRATILVLTCRLLRPGGGISARTFPCLPAAKRSEEHTSELQSLMRISYAVFCLKKKTPNTNKIHHYTT